MPNKLTILRLIMIPFFVLAFYLPFKWAPFCCVLIFIIAAITDWFDGFLARRWKQKTSFGAFIDPVVDKIMVSIALVLISEYFHSWWITLPTSIIIVREIIVSALREWMAEIGKSSSIVVSWAGKIKTTTQMLALIALLWRTDNIISNMGIVTLYIATFLTFLSMLQYLYAVWSNLFEH